MRGEGGIEWDIPTVDSHREDMEQLGRNRGDGRLLLVEGVRVCNHEVQVPLDGFLSPVHAVLQTLLYHLQVQGIRHLQPTTSVPGQCLENRGPNEREREMIEQTRMTTSIARRTDQLAVRLVDVERHRKAMVEADWPLS